MYVLLFHFFWFILLHVVFPNLPEPERPNDISEPPGSSLYPERLSPCNLWSTTRHRHRKHSGQHAGYAATRPTGLSWSTYRLIITFRALFLFLARRGVRVRRTDIFFSYLVAHTWILTRTFELIFYGVLVEWRPRCYFTSLF